MPLAREKVEQLQQADDDIRAILELKATRAVKPRYEEIAHMSPEVKNYWAQWGQLVLKDGLLYRQTQRRAEVQRRAHQIQRMEGQH